MHVEIEEGVQDLAAHSKGLKRGGFH
jgi:hypothetical protein